MFHIYNIGGNNRELDIRKNIEPADTGVPVFPPAGGLPVIKYNTPEQNVSFFALFSALFFLSGGRISIPATGAGLLPELTGTGVPAKGCAILCQSVRRIFSA